MKISIDNLGPIGHVEIDCSAPLVLLTGLNGTGKTYISYVLYSLFSKFFVDEDVLGWSKMDRKKEDVLDVDIIYKILIGHVNATNRKLPAIFGTTNESEMLRNAKVKLLTTKKELKSFLMNADGNITGEALFKFSKKIGSLDYSLEKNFEDPRFEKENDNIELVNTIIIKSLLFNTLLECIMTAERSGIYMFSKELALGRLQETGIGLALQRKSRYPLPIVESLMQAEDMANAAKGKSEYADLADNIEKSILHGHLDVTSKGDFVFHGMNMDADIAFTLSSSAVKTISPIIFFLRHQADHNLLFIDEPETNLHPHNQVLLARIFAKMINAGIHMIVATHSDYIIREINTMLMLSSIKENPSKYGYTEDEVLKKEQINPYNLMHDEKLGKVVSKPIEITNTGFDVNLIDEVIAMQNEKAQDIYSDIDEDE